MKKQWCCKMAVISLVFASCNSRGLYPVSGKVTYKGVPAAGAVVTFHRKNVDPMNEHTIMGLVQPDGSFTLDCGHLGKGAPPGEYDVLIVWRQDSKHASAGAPKGPDRLKGRYADPKRPLLHAVVKAETHSVGPFELADGESVRKK
jgi:hypothetical protein